jgi:gas vesicle protein
MLSYVAHEIFFQERSTMKTSNEAFETARVATKINAGPVLAGGLIGGLVGAVVALLFAPSSGSEARAKIREKAITLQDRATESAKDAVSQARTKANELKGNARDKAEKLKQRGREITHG